jgi:uncharacterized repeat protein (TIGR01451 family)
MKRASSKSNHWPLLLVLAQTLILPPLRAQMIFYYDASGNRTSSFVSSPTGVGTTSANGTQTITVGSPLSMDVLASGSGPFTYQWLLNGVSISGATDATYFKPGVTGTDAGTYSVISTGASGSQTNVLGTVTVVATTNTLFSLTYALSQYVAVGASGTVITSSNLVAWTAQNSATTNNLFAVVYGNGTLVSVGSAGTVVTSTNGVNWVLRNAGSSHDLMGVTFGNGIFVAAGAGGTTLTSPDGVNWTPQTYDNPTLEAVAFANNLFVAVGTGGSIWTSSNGTNWLARNFVTTNTLNSVSYGNGIYVAVGTEGLILTSSTGTNWTTAPANTLETFTTVLYFKNTFFAIGAVGENFISADGVNWNESDAGTFEQLFGAAVGNNVPVAVGEAGTIVQVPYSLVDHFVWSPIASPQRVSQSFSATLTAKDAANNTLSNFNGSVTLAATTSITATTNNILGNITGTYSPGTNTSGYAFTPNADLLVTALRHFDLADSITVWEESGNVLASVAVSSISNSWVSTALTAPLTLKAGRTYVLAAYSRTGVYYRGDLGTSFADGTLDQAFNLTGPDLLFTNQIPTTPQFTFWFLVDLAYTVQRTITNTLSPPSASFTSGVASITPSVSVAGQGVALSATDSAGHTGLSAPFNVYAANDLAVTLSASPNPVSVQSNLTYSVTIMNSGPGSDTGVTMTNTLPANVSYVSASSTQGSCQFTNGKVTCSVGTMTTQLVTVTIVVMATNAGVVLTNTVSVAGNNSEPTLTNNTATITTYVPPTLSIGDVNVYEGNVGISYVQVPIYLSSASPLAINYTVQTLDGTNATPALARTDYVPIQGDYVISPGYSVVHLSIGIQGNTLVQSNRQFTIQLSHLTNATLANSLATVTIYDDDSQPGNVQNLVWSAVNSPQVTNLPFAATITAKDASGLTLTNFHGPASVTGLNVGPDSTNTLLNSQAPSDSATLSISTIGYLFTPTNDIYVTHVRSYAGSKVSIWTWTGFPILTQAVTSVPGQWVDTQLPAPVHLSANNDYVIGAFTDGNTYYWGNSGPAKFNDGLITGSYSAPGDAFPTNLDWPQWYLVDLRYARPAAISVSPSTATTNNFTNGVWSGTISANELGTNFYLIADDTNGHVVVTSPFGVYMTNDLAVTLSLVPAAPLVFSNLIYTVTVLNPGPNASTGVFVTNVLPVGPTFVSATSSQGSCSPSGSVVTCNLGTISAGSSATVTITVKPLVAGLSITNTVQVVRNEADPNLGDNSATSVVVPSLAVSLALAQASDYSLSTWRSGGDALWSSQTNTAHDGLDAAQSGSIVDSQQTWMETTVRGPGTLSFWWKVSSQTNGDIFYFLTNNVAAASISGNVNWQQLNFNVAPGLTALRWSFIDDVGIHSGSNAAWLDQVSYTIPSFSLSSPMVDTNGHFFFTLNGTVGQQLVLQTSTNLILWTSLTTNSLTNIATVFLDGAVTNSPSKFYRALFFNQ